jgi:uncharacterized damage-inducible protein DinB
MLIQLSVKLPAQMFNHQTHHRGQIHALLTSVGIDMGPTDLPMLPLLNETLRAQ